MSARVFLIGESNPYGADPEFALYPAPIGCSGWRLCHTILGMDPDEYLATFERRNLLSSARWSVRAAREAAAAICAEAIADDRLILLGRKVTMAFDDALSPFCFRGRLLSLPHPSGLCRVWYQNQPEVVERARATVREFVPRIAHAIGTKAGAA